MIGMFSNIHWL